MHLVGGGIRCADDPSAYCRHTVLVYCVCTFACCLRVETLPWVPVHMVALTIQSSVCLCNLMYACVLLYVHVHMYVLCVLVCPVTSTSVHVVLVWMFTLLYPFVYVYMCVCIYVDQEQERPQGAGHR